MDLSRQYRYPAPTLPNGTRRFPLFLWKFPDSPENPANNGFEHQFRFYYVIEI
jgi:hypothetical protein